MPCMGLFMAAVGPAPMSTPGSMCCAALAQGMTLAHMHPFGGATYCRPLNRISFHKLRVEDFDHSLLTACRLHFIR